MKKTVFLFLILTTFNAFAEKTCRIKSDGNIPDSLMSFFLDKGYSVSSKFESEEVDYVLSHSTWSSWIRCSVASMMLAGVYGSGDSSRYHSNLQLHQAVRNNDFLQFNKRIDVEGSKRRCYKVNGKHIKRSVKKFLKETKELDIPKC